MEGIVTFDDWQKLELRVGKILEVEIVPNADKLYKLTIDLVDEKRTVVSGLREYYTEEQLQNKIIILFCNLQPRKIKGIESKGMVLAAVKEDEAGTKSVKLLQPDEGAEVGSRIS